MDDPLLLQGKIVQLESRLRAAEALCQSTTREIWMMDVELSKVEEQLAVYTAKAEKCGRLEERIAAISAQLEETQQFNHDLRAEVHQAQQLWQDSQRTNRQLRIELDLARQELRELRSPPPPVPQEVRRVSLSSDPDATLVEKPKVGYQNLLDQLLATSPDIEISQFRPQDSCISFSSSTRLEMGEHSVMANLEGVKLHSRVRVDSCLDDTYVGRFLGPEEAIPHLNRLRDKFVEGRGAGRVTRAVRVASSCLPSQTVTHDISVSGMTLQLSKPLPDNERFDCDIEVNDDLAEQLTVLCQVAGSRPYHGDFLVRVLFVWMSRQDRMRLLKLVETPGTLEHAEPRRSL